MSILRKEILKLVKDKKRVITENIEEKYMSDMLGRLKGKVDAVIKPISTDEVSKILKFAYKNNINVTPRGAGTNLVGSTVLAKGGIILDLSLMNRILKIDYDTLEALVEPGVILGEFQEYVEDKGLFYPPDPGEKKATIGGNISTNAGGMRAVKYGVTRDYVMGLEVVLSNGTVMKLGSQNIKDSSGLSLKNLVIGSEGTLAVITKCLLKLLPKPEYSISAIAAFESLNDGINNVLNIIKKNADPTAIEFVERKALELGEKYLNLKFPYPDAKAYIILTFDGRKEEVTKNLNIVKETVLKEGALDFITLDDEKICSDVWKIRGALVKSVEAVSEQEPIDIVVPINKTSKFINFVNKLEKETNMQMVSFGHAGDGNVHLCVVRGDRSSEDWKRDKDRNLKLLYKEAYKLGGLTSGEHGIGLSKRPYFLVETKKENLELMRRVKFAFDDRQILNSDKAYN